ncbi:methyltransferase domain-containing protein [Methanoculleus sp. YWC-01]|jgi:SAM-dependent methyltransferase|uniref:Methyltransferase domain-containing protein n=1 Tax=Methanoculleus nereidis TaxID=2735141 RepID=A0ABU3Z5C4_9EURY|nr:methyltransferase domain-containing protein [Methanoculleus sp. YWC-01]MDV4343754.1 methyltransferase domain-containing protein [Methanoculleus sp. YWC-01]
MSGKTYVHGYTEREAERLRDQAETLTGLLHDDTRYPAGSRVLEAGCGTGAQTVILARNCPGARITSVDISEASLGEARKRVQAEGITNVTFEAGDIFDLQYEPGSFDHIFLCFVLEHLAEPCLALECLRPLLREGGTITVIEGDHGSAYFHPDSPYARRAIGCLVDLQREMGGNALIGRELYPLVAGAGYRDVHVSPRMVYVDATRPDLVLGFTRLTFTAMVEGVGEDAVARGMMSRQDWERGIADLYRTSEPDGVFCYTFFKATGRK